MVRSPRRLQALADRSPDAADERKDEPYRRALTGIYARLAATAWSLDQLEAAHRPSGRRLPTGRADEFKADLDTIRDSLGADISVPWPAAGCGRCGARWTCSASISPTLDLRQNSDVHERVMAELVEAAGVGRTMRPWTRPLGWPC